MSLDIAILGEDGCPKNHVSIGVDAHHRRMERLAENLSGLLARICDYYADAEFEFSELAKLADEVSRLRTNAKDDGALFSLLNAVSELIDNAITEEKRLFVIAD